MATPAEDELKAKAELYLKRVADLSGAATKTALISFSALAVIWFSQIRPQSKQLIDYVFKTLPAAYLEVQTAKSALDREKKELREASEDVIVFSRPALNASDRVTAEPIGATRGQLQPQPVFSEFTNQKETVEKKSGSVGFKRAEFENIAKSVSFELFGLKLPVPPLYAALVWNFLLVMLLLYLARARLAVWALCADALSTLKKLGKNLDDIAGDAPLWIAPPPSRPGKDSSMTTKDLRSAFGWNRLETLPSIATTVLFLLLSLLQLTVTAEAYGLLGASNNFGKWLKTSIPAVALPKESADAPRPVLERRISTLTESLASADKQSEPSKFDRYILEERLKELTVGPIQGPLIALFLFLMLISTVLLVIWWFRPWSIPSRLSDTGRAPQSVAAAMLVVVTVVCLFLVVGWLKPNWGWSLADKLANTLPNVTYFLAASVISFCLIELIALRFSRSRDDN
jgi:hypothetical protein